MKLTRMARKPTSALTADVLAGEGFTRPADAAANHHFRKRISGGLTIEVYLTNAGPRVIIFRNGRWFEASAKTAAELCELVGVLDG